MSDAGNSSIVAPRVLAALDLTRLGEDETADSIRALCAAAAASAIRPAAVCVRAEHIGTAHVALARAGAPEIAVATVANFPCGERGSDEVLREIRDALAAGADEVDVVYPWRAHLAGDHGTGPELVRQCRAECGSRPLKVIIESGEVAEPTAIRELSLAALDAGADLVKTSTGKTRVGATCEAARVILECVHERGRGGLKVSGGIRTLEQACGYFGLAERICGTGWAVPRRFRIGTSSFLGGMRG